MSLTGYRIAPGLCLYTKRQSSQRDHWQGWADSQELGMRLSRTSHLIVAVGLVAGSREVGIEERIHSHRIGSINGRSRRDCREFEGSGVAVADDRLPRRKKIAHNRSATAPPTARAATLTRPLARTGAGTFSTHGMERWEKCEKQNYL